MLSIAIEVKFDVVQKKLYRETMLEIADRQTEHKEINAVIGNKKNTSASEMR